MKTKFTLLFFVFCILHFAFCAVPCALSQTPQGFNYQAVARDASGISIVNTPLPVRVTIQTDSLGGTILWQELHQNIVSNGLGIINLVVGKGARQPSSALASFSAVDWSVSPKFIKTEIDYSGWKTMGITRLWSVPYSMVAEELAGAVKRLTVTGETSDMEEALFEVRNRTGQTVFAVYNEGVRVYVSDGDAKGLKSGFAVGGFGTDKAESTKYMFVGKDSVRIYLDNNPLTKGLKSGFAVGGYDLTKGSVQNYLEVTDASTTVFVNDNAGKAVKGGFAVGGFDATKAETAPFMNITRQNYFIGHESGLSLTEGRFNSVLGYQSGRSITTGESNVFLGYQSGFSNTTGIGNLFLGFQSGNSNTEGSYNTYVGYRSGSSNSGAYGGYNTFLGSFTGENTVDGTGNTFIGYSAGKSNSYGGNNVFLGYNAGLSGTNAWSNVFIGFESGKSITNGYSNVFIGEFTGEKTTTGYQNVFIGDEAGKSNVAGSYNVLIGTGAGQKANADNNILVGFGSGYDITSGNNNLILGQQAGFSTNTGTNNVYIGHGSGYANTSGTGNVFLGHNAGWPETGSNKLYVDNSNTASPLIYGDFSANALTINGTATITGASTLTGAATFGNTATLNGTYFRIATNPGTGATPTNYVYQGTTASTAKNYAFTVHDALWVTGPAFLDKYLNIGVSGASALSVADMEAIWFNGTYFSWGYGGSYNYFADKVTIGNTASSSYALYVQGSAYSTGGWAGSDARWKKDLDPINNILPAVLSLNPVKYNWRTDEFPDMNFEGERQIGLIAQEVEKIFPELVRTDDNGYKAVSYEKLTVVLLEGMKEQQKQIEELRKMVTELKTAIVSSR
jgi:hypothetical protein